MKRVVSAYKARTNFGEIINEVYYRGDEVWVEKMGKPMVRITKIEGNGRRKFEERTFLKFWGIWRDVDVRAMKKDIRILRRKGMRRIKPL